MPAVRNLGSMAGLAGGPPAAGGVATAGGVAASGSTAGGGGTGCAVAAARSADCRPLIALPVFADTAGWLVNYLAPETPGAGGASARH